jgi:hypothetical protein
MVISCEDGLKSDQQRNMKQQPSGTYHRRPPEHTLLDRNAPNIFDFVSGRKYEDAIPTDSSTDLKPCCLQEHQGEPCPKRKADHT